MELGPPVAIGEDTQQAGALFAPAEDLSRDILKGRGAFGHVDDMYVGRWYTVEFVVGPSEEAIADEAAGMAIDPSQPVYVGSFMRVTLLDDRNFQIKPKPPVIQMTGEDKSASWSWNVSPTRDGTFTLQARVEVLQRNPDGTYTTLEAKTRRVSVEVKVGTWQGFMNALKNATSLAEAMGTLFGAWDKALLLLIGLIGTIFGVPIAIYKGMKKLRAARARSAQSAITAN